MSDFTDERIAALLKWAQIYSGDENGGFEAFKDGVVFATILDEA